MASLGETRYVIESKGYFRRDNFKLLEKLELLELKKQGLFMPYTYGIDIEHEMLNTTEKHPKLETLNLNSNSARKPRNTAPHSSNYLSSYRERVNRADKKIRDLFKNADKVRIKKKLSTNLNQSHISRYLSCSRTSRRPLECSFVK